MHALIVDDSRAIRSVIARMLRQAGWTVSEAGHGQEALEVLASLDDAPDIALVDWNMPIMDGYALLQALRSNPGYEQMQIMMVTTETEIERMQLALAAGANEYLMKPFTQEALAEKLGILGLDLAA
ncbi:MAG: response regulator [Nannocystaceae bacterium]|jgi:two-component system chemotaxis response regulator CheY